MLDSFRKFMDICVNWIFDGKSMWTIMFNNSNNNNNNSIYFYWQWCQPCPFWLCLPKLPISRLQSYIIFYSLFNLCIVLGFLTWTTAPPIPHVLIVSSRWCIGLLFTAVWDFAHPSCKCMHPKVIQAQFHWLL